MKSSRESFASLKKYVDRMHNEILALERRVAELERKAAPFAPFPPFNPPPAVPPVNPHPPWTPLPIFPPFNPNYPTIICGGFGG